MSRRPAAPQATGAKLTRNPSSASLAMPPPGKVPTRPPSVTSSASSAMPARNGNGGDDAGSRSGSPKKIAGGRRTISASNGPANGKGKAAEGENGEINIQVVVRCRGRSSIELASTSPVITTTSGALSKAITVETTPLPSSTMATFTTASSYGGNQPSTKTYPFDKVFGPEADQTMVFREVAEGMLDEVLAGYNCTIFAYGQTGTGKTYTMQGDLELTPLLAPRDSAGIVPRVLHRLFSLLEAAQNTEYSVKCSYVELYNEEVRDLLSEEYQPVAAGDKQPMSLGSGGNGGGAGGLKLYEDGKKGVMIQGLEETGARNLKEALRLLEKGCQRRQVAETKMNTESSRSHTIFSITVHVKEASVTTGGDDLLRIGKFNLVDLAGSEAIGRSGATDKRAREAGMINQSLLTLGRVISALVEKGSHIPYRESKLTRLLQDSLGGRTKTCIVATVSPTRSNMEETLSTLDYAIRAKSIRNRPEVNAHMTKTGLLKEYIGDIERLKAEVMAAREKNGIYIPEEQWREMHEVQAKQKSDLQEAELRANAATVELSTKKKEFDELSTRMICTAKELEEVREKERELEELMEVLKGEMARTRERLEEEGWVGRKYEEGEDRVGQVAENLRGVANESVKDVGGLFEKIARKAQVLGKNADAATRFGAELQGLSREMQNGLRGIEDARGGFGQQLETELEAFAKRRQDDTDADLVALEASFSSFNSLTATLSASIQQGQVDADATCASLAKIKEDVHTSVRRWAKEVSAKSKGMVEEVLGHQQQHLAKVEGVLEQTAQLVDQVILETRGYLAEERAAAERSKRLAEDAANAEIARLRNQNHLLVNLLASEKAKTAKLRTELVTNLTQMIEDFTDAQDQSWSAAVEGVRVENERGVEAMEGYAMAAGHSWEESESRRQGVMGQMDGGESRAKQTRLEGVQALSDVSSGLRSRLEVYGKETIGEAKRLNKVVEGHCTVLGETSSALSKQVVSRADEQAASIEELSAHAKTTTDSSRTRAIDVAESSQRLASTLLESHASSSRSVAQSHQEATTALSALATSTASFLASGIQEDVPTGVTPRKKAWNVQQDWERTGPREALLAEYRRRKAAGLPVDTGLSLDNGHVDVVAGETGHSRGSSVDHHDDEIDPANRENTIPSVPSTASLVSQVDTSQEPPIVEVRSIIAPSKMSKKLGGMPGKKQLGGSGGVGQGREEEKINMVVLGEGTVNVPRKGRR